MATSTVTAPFETVRDLLDFLGVQAERVRFTPTPGTATEADLIALNDRKQGLYELIDGVLVEKAMGYEEAVLANVLGTLMRIWCDEHRLGVVASESAMMRFTSGRVRMPDLSFASWGQFPDRKLPAEPVANLHPDLAVEILSRGNTRREMRLKRKDYFGSGCRMSWEIDPRRRRVTVFTAPDESTVLGEDDVIEAGDAFPGFTFTLREVFERAEGRH